MLLVILHWYNSSHLIRNLIKVCLLNKQTFRKSTHDLDWLSSLDMIAFKKTSVYSLKKNFLFLYSIWLLCIAQNMNMSSAEWDTCIIEMGFDGSWPQLLVSYHMCCNIVPLHFLSINNSFNWWSYDYIHACFSMELQNHIIFLYLHFT